HRDSYRHTCSFSQRDADPRALHSFPTRRSSDLRRPGTLTPADQEESRERDDRRPADARSRSHLGPRYPLPTARPRNVSRRSSSTDRKSTRLNSSHVAISYAVFCLKKKTDTNTSA